jgi:hypothetical protein
MPRPHIEFIQAQALGWAEGLPSGGARPDVASKILSIDDVTGAASCVVRYPAGWDRTTSGYLSTDEEFYVLDGALTINGITYDRDSFAHLPEGHLRKSASSKEGAVLLTFFDGPVDAVAANAPGPMFRADRLVEKISAPTADWGNADLDAMGLRDISTSSRLLSLFTDPDTGEITYLTGVMPFKSESSPERHPVGQEFYILGGSLAGVGGVMQAGAYCWRPPLVTHGPYGSPTGALIILRSVGGPLTTELDATVPHTYEPDHSPVLPPELAEAGSKPFPPQGRY